MNKTISKQEFELMMLRPALYNDKEFEIEIECKNLYLHRTDINEALAIKTTPGDTVSVHIKCCFENDTASFGEYITMYMCGEALTEFINKVGISNQNGNFKVKVKFIYAIYNKSEFDYDEPRKEEIIGCKLLKFSSTENDYNSLSTK